MDRRFTVGALGFSLVLSTAGCAPALREPPPLAQLASAAGSGIDGEAAMRRAAESFARREVDAVNEAAELWLGVAANDPDRIEAWVGAARAKAWLADHLQRAEDRKLAAVGSVQAAQWCKRRAPGAIECDYWLALALGIQARERRSTGTDALPRIIELLESVDRRDASFDRAGPSRVLALLYLRAPGWPAGPGDPDLGLEYAERAVELAPDHAPNHLALGEALAELDEPGPSTAAFEHALALADDAITDGDPDADEWRREALAALKRDG